MACAYSHDLRFRVLETVDPGLSRGAAGERYRLDIATLIRWAAQAALKGKMMPKLDFGQFDGRLRGGVTKRT